VRRRLVRVGEEKLEIVPEVEGAILTDNTEISHNQLNYTLEKEKKGQFGHLARHCL
jgi:predicted transcriptional regulator